MHSHTAKQPRLTYLMLFFMYEIKSRLYNMFFSRTTQKYNIYLLILKVSVLFTSSFSSFFLCFCRYFVVAFFPYFFGLYQYWIELDWWTVCLFLLIVVSILLSHSIYKLPPPHVQKVQICSVFLCLDST